MFKKLLQLLKKIPWYGYVFAVCTIGFQSLVYMITGQINAGRADLLNSVNVKIPVIDDAFPFIPNSVLFYFCSFIFWGIGALVASTCGKRHVINLSIGYFICCVVGLMFFVFMPTYIDRVQEGVLDIVRKPDGLNGLLLFLYNNDGGDVGVNLFPSFHCFVSMWWCLAVQFQKNIKRGYKFFTIAAVILICVSTLTTKQHYILDVFGGLGLAIIVYALIAWINPGKYIIKEKSETN